MPILCLTACDPYDGKRPYNQPNTRWVSTNPEILSGDCKFGKKKFTIKTGKDDVNEIDPSITEIVFIRE